jgi:protein phosphatase methylesterase 1
VVVDVVEGTALEALASMHTVLQGRPRMFASVEQAVEWCVRSGQVRNQESARVSMPGQVVSSTGVLAAKMVEDMVESDHAQGGGQSARRLPSVSRDSIREEAEDAETETAGDD